MIAAAETPLICSACGQPIMTRRGVCMRRSQIALFDLIDRRPAGVEANELARRLYPDTPTYIGRHRVKAHVNQINDRLAETDWRIVNRFELKHGRRYFLVEEKTP